MRLSLFPIQVIHSFCAAMPNNSPNNAILPAAGRDEQECRSLFASLQEPESRGPLYPAYFYRQERHMRAMSSPGAHRQRLMEREGRERGAREHSERTRLKRAAVSQRLEEWRRK
jgi:hypothetical protein